MDRKRPKNSGFRPFPPQNMLIFQCAGVPGHADECALKPVPGVPGQLRYIKIRMAHLPGATIFQPDIILSGFDKREYYVPQYFWAPSVNFLGGNNDYAMVPFAMENGAELILVFFKRDLVLTFPDGTQVYKCYYVPSRDCKTKLSPDGRYRYDNGRFEISIYHHTSGPGLKGILSSRQLWASKKNIQGNGYLDNINYAYFTTLSRIKNEIDLLGIAMSSWGKTGLLPINAPNTTVALSEFERSFA